MKKQILGMGLVIMLVLAMGLVVAQEEIETTEDTPFNFISWFKHTFNIQIFSVVGDARRCSSNPDKEFSFDKDELLTRYASDYCSSGYGLWNIFIGGDSWNPWKEYDYDKINIRCGSSAGCNAELYCCDHPEPKTNSQCRNWYGSLYEKETASCSAWYDFDERPDLDGYKCTTIYGTERKIPFVDDTFNYCILGEGEEEIVNCYYYPESGSSCLKKTYPQTTCPSSYQGQILYDSKSVCESNIPKEPEPTPTQTCIDLGTDMNKCFDRSDCIWTRFSNCRTIQDAGCTGMREQDCLQGNDCKWIGTTCTTKTTPTTLSAVIYDIEVPTSVETVEEVIVKFKVKNNGDTGDYLLETGIIPKSVAKDWGFKYAGEGFGIFDWLTQQNVECCENQPNIFAKTTKLESGEIDTFKIKIPKAPYSEIRDLCYDNVYWDGEGEYVLYITVKTGCYPEGKEVTYETRIINVTITSEDKDKDGDEVVTPTKPIKTITWSEYYSTSNEDLDVFGKGNICRNTNECPLKSGYDVECDKSGTIQKRIYKAREEYCEEWLDTGGITGIPTKIAGMLAGDLGFCDVVIGSYSFIGNLFIGEPGMCMASSTTWYGKLWDGALKIVGGMGLPTQYVMIITLMFLITLIGIIIRMVT